MCTAAGATQHLTLRSATRITCAAAAAEAICKVQRESHVQQLLGTFWPMAHALHASAEAAGPAAAVLVQQVK
jgi:hypothetical protein